MERAVEVGPAPAYPEFGFLGRRHRGRLWLGCCTEREGRGRACFIVFIEPVCCRSACRAYTAAIRAALETLGLVHEHEFVITLRAKSAGFGNLRYTRIESTSADCSARLACDIDAEEGRATQQAGIPGKVRNRDQDVPWMLTVTFRIGRPPT